MRATKNVAGRKPASRRQGRKLSAVPSPALELPATGRVGEIMTRQVVSVNPDTSISTVIELLLSRRISGVPVVDEEGVPVGLISKTDLLRDLQEGGDARQSSRMSFAGHEEEGRTAEEVMTPAACSLSEHASIVEASGLMFRGGMHRLPVVDSEGKLVGIVSSLDVLRWVAGL